MPRREPAGIEHVEALYARRSCSARPQSAERILRREGLDYFFISTRIPVQDVLQCTALFSPDTIQNHFERRVDRWARCVAELEGARR